MAVLGSGCTGARDGTMPGPESAAALSAGPDGVLFAVVEGTVLRGRSAGAVAFDRWGSLPTADEATDVDAADALVVRVALREGAVAVLDRETGTLRERLTLGPLRRDDGVGSGTPGGVEAGGHPGGVSGSERLPARIDLVAMRALPDGSVVGLVAGPEPVAVRWDAARQPSVWATAAVLPPGAFDLERDGDDVVVLGAGGRLVWLDRLGTPLARHIASVRGRPAEAVALGRSEAGLVLVGDGGARRIDRSGRVGILVPLAGDARAVEPLGSGTVAVLAGSAVETAGAVRIGVAASRWALPGEDTSERRAPAP